MEKIDINLISFKDNSLMRIDILKYSKLKYSIKKFGQLRPIIIDEYFEIIEGHLIYKAIKEIGLNYCYILKIENLSLQDKIDIYNSLNLLQNKVKPVDLFEKWNNSNINLDNNCIPFEKKDIIKYLKYLNWNPEEYSKDRKQISEFLF